MGCDGDCDDGGGQKTPNTLAESSGVPSKAREFVQSR